VVVGLKPAPGEDASEKDTDAAAVAGALPSLEELATTVGEAEVVLRGVTELRCPPFSYSSSCAPPHVTRPLLLPYSDAKFWFGKRTGGR
jgi:hypothetical protein